MTMTTNHNKPTSLVNFTPISSENIAMSRFIMILVDDENLLLQLLLKSIFIKSNVFDKNSSKQSILVIVGAKV